MTLLLQIGIANVAVASVLAVLAFAAGKVTRRPALVHSLWLLVLLKLVTPPLFWLPITWPGETEPTPQAQAGPADDVLVAQNRKVDEATRQRVELIVIQTEGRLIAVPPALAFVVPKEPPPAPPPPAASAPKPSSLAWLTEWAAVAAPWLPVVFWLWLAGAAAWFVWAGVHLFRFRRLLRFARPASPALQAEADRLAAQLGLNRGPAVWLLPGALPPMVWSGAGRARLYFPAGLLERLGDEERATLLAHELAHVCRRDHWVRLLELLVLGLYWWCPLVWWARRQLQASEEECCDAWVVGELPARSYATAILRTLDFLAEGRRPAPLGVSALSTRVQQLKKRLTQIMQNRTPKRLSAAGQLAVAVLALLMLPLLPTLVFSRPGRSQAPAEARAAAPAPQHRQAQQPQTVEGVVTFKPTVFRVVESPATVTTVAFVKKDRLRQRPLLESNDEPWRFRVLTPVSPQPRPSTPESPPAKVRLVGATGAADRFATTRVIEGHPVRLAEEGAPPDAREVRVVSFTEKQKALYPVGVWALKLQPSVPTSARPPVAEQ